MSKDSMTPEKRLSAELTHKIQARWGMVYRSVESLKMSLRQADPELWLEDATTIQNPVEQRVHETVVAGTAINAVQLEEQKQENEHQQQIDSVRQAVREAYNDQAA